MAEQKTGEELLIGALSILHGEEDTDNLLRFLLPWSKIKGALSALPAWWVKHLTENLFTFDQKTAPSRQQILARVAFLGQCLYFSGDEKQTEEDVAKLLASVGLPYLGEVEQVEEVEPVKPVKPIRKSKLKGDLANGNGQDATVPTATVAGDQS